MVVFIEPLGKPFAHLSVVKSLVYAEFKNNPKSKFIFKSTKEYFDSLPSDQKKILTFEKIVSRKMSICNIIDIVKIVIGTLIKYNKNKDLKVYLLFSKSYSNFILKLISLFFFKEKERVYILIHGELQNINLKGKFSFKLDGIVQRLLYWIDSKLVSNVKFVIISDFIFSKLIDCLGYNPSNIISLDLPYLYDDFTHKKLKDDNTLVISIVGVSSIAKNSHYLNFLAKKFENEIKNGSLMLCTSGRNDDVEFSKNINVLELNNKYLLPTEEYESRIQMSDLLIFFNDNNYNLVSSGSFFDCINYKKPLIAIITQQWKYNFDKYGNIGILCENLNKIYTHVDLILKNRSLLKDFDIELNNARLKTNTSSNWDKILTKLN